MGRAPEMVEKGVVPIAHERPEQANSGPPRIHAVVQALRRCACRIRAIPVSARVEMEAGRDRDAIEAVEGANRGPIAGRHFRDCSRSYSRRRRLHSRSCRVVGLLGLLGLFFGGCALCLEPLYLTL